MASVMWSRSSGRRWPWWLIAGSPATAPTPGTSPAAPSASVHRRARPAVPTVHAGWLRCRTGWSRALAAWCWATIWRIERRCSVSACDDFIGMTLEATGFRAGHGGCPHPGLRRRCRQGNRPPIPPRSHARRQRCLGVARPAEAVSSPWWTAHRIAPYCRRMSLTTPPHSALTPKAPPPPAPPRAAAARSKSRLATARTPSAHPLAAG